MLRYDAPGDREELHLEAELQPLLEEVLTSVLELQGAAWGTITLLDHDRHDLRTVAARGLPSAYAELRCPLDAGACGLAFTERRSVIVEDVERDPIFAGFRDAARAAGIRAVYSAPLVDGDGHAIGTIATHFGHRHRPSGREVRAVELYGRLAGRAIGNERRAELVRRREAHARLVIESSPIGIMVANTEGTILDVNEAFTAILGYSREEALSGRLNWRRDLTPPDLRHLDDQAVDHLRRRGTHAPFEKEYLARDGARVPVLVATAFLGGPEEVGVGFIVDLSERKRVEAALGESEARFRTLADAVPAIIFTGDPPMACDYVNDRFYEYTGMARGSERGDGWLASVYPDDRARVAAAAQSAVESGRPYEGRFRMRAADGTYRWFLTRAVPTALGGGRILRYFGTCTDIHAIVEAEEQREALLALERAARDQAQAANRAKDDFLALLSHELRTPLATIRLWSTVLQRSAPDAQTVRRAIDGIERGTVTQSRLIEEILDVSRIVSGKLRIEEHDVDLAALVRQAVDGVATAAESRCVALVPTLAAVPSIVGDPERLQQVVSNLLSNALKYTPEGGRIIVRLAPGGDHVELSVTDSGEGIAAELLPVIFERFKQGDTATTRRHAGLGLGLAIARHIVELHAGTIAAASDGPGQGATFTVTLPLPARSVTSAGAAVRAGGTRENASARVLDGVHVLAVDDDRDTRESIGIILREFGARVTIASSAAEAIACLRTARIDALVTDIAMPEEDGYSLLRRVRALAGAERRVPVVALTAYAGAEDRGRALAAGFDAHLAKPVAPAALVEVLVGLARRT